MNDERLKQTLKALQLKINGLEDQQVLSDDERADLAGYKRDIRQLKQDNIAQLKKICHAQQNPPLPSEIIKTELSQGSTVRKLTPPPVAAKRTGMLVLSASLWRACSCLCWCEEEAIEASERDPLIV